MNNSQQQDSTSRGLSSKELKQKLIQVVKNKGIYDSMKVITATLISKNFLKEPNCHWYLKFLVTTQKQISS